VAGYLGINPDPFTIRELWLMSEGKQREEWEHTAQIMMIIQNVNCTKRKDMKSADYFNPLIPKNKKQQVGKFVTKDFSILKKMLPNVTGTVEGKNGS